MKKKSINPLLGIKDITNNKRRKPQNLIKKDSIEKEDKPRKHVMDAFKNSMTKYKSTYKKLAK